MEVKEILDQKVVDLNMIAKTKDEVILHLAELLTDAGYVENKEGYIKDVYERENEGITGIGGHVAIPHGKSDYVKKVGIAIGKTKNFIEWESYDDEKCNLFFLFAVPSDSESVKDHLRLIAQVAGKLGNKEAMKKIQNITTYEDIVNVF